MNRVWTHAFLTTFIACGGLIASSAMANVRLPAIFGSNMVLQQGAPVVVWGWAETGEAVTVSVAGQEVYSTCRWTDNVYKKNVSGEASKDAEAILGDPRLAEKVKTTESLHDMRNRIADLLEKLGAFSVAQGQPSSGGLP